MDATETTSTELSSKQAKEKQSKPVKRKAGGMIGMGLGVKPELAELVGQTVMQRAEVRQQRLCRMPITMGRSPSSSGTTSRSTTCLSHLSVYPAPVLSH